jgi:hypothetical protein
VSALRQLSSRQRLAGVLAKVLIDALGTLGGESLNELQPISRPALTDALSRAATMSDISPESDEVAAALPSLPTSLARTRPP